MPPEFVVFNPPVPVEFRQYELQIEKMLEKYSKIRGVDCICSMGSIKAPGYSDIDLVIFFNEEFDRKNAGEFHHRSPDLDQNLVLHAPVCIGPNYSSDVWRMLYMSNLTPLYGTVPSEFIGIPPDPVALEHFSLSVLIDFNVGRLMQYAACEDAGRINQRHWSTVLWSHTHSELLLNQAGIPLTAKSASILEEIRRDRERWLREGVPQNKPDFIDLFIRSKYLTIEILNATLKAEGNLLHSKGVSRPSRVTRGNKTILFKDIDEFCPTCKSFRFRGRMLPVSHTLTAPLSYQKHMAAYRFLDERHVSPPDDCEYLKFLKSRRVAAEQHGVFCSENNLSFSNGPYLGLPVVPQVGAKYKIAAVAHRLATLFTK